MTSTLYCLKGCIVRGHHNPSCEWQMALETLTPSDRLPVECAGCLPRPAEVGMLCGWCFSKFEDALSRLRSSSRLPGLVTHLRSIDKAPRSLDGVRSAPGSVVIMPATWQTADEIWKALAKVAVMHAAEKRIPEPKWHEWTSLVHGISSKASLVMVTQAVAELMRWVSASPESVVSGVEGAKAALEFTTLVQRAFFAHEMQQSARRVKYIRCRTCNQQSLLWRPPLEYLDDVEVTCTTPGCDGKWSPDLIAFDLAVLAQAKAEELAAEAAKKVA